MGPIRRRNLRGVLLDVDGTLIDSNECHARAWSEALREFGREVRAEDIRPLIGMGGDKLIPMLLGVEAGSDTGRAFTRRRNDVFLTRYVPTLRATRGARELVERLEREGLRLVIATSAGEEELIAMLRQVELDGLIRDRTSPKAASHSKPEPDVVHAALRTARIEPDEAILLGDTPYDVDAARHAGVDTVALLCGGWDADALSGAIAIYEDPADLLAHFTSSPFSCVALDRVR